MASICPLFWACCACPCHKTAFLLTKLQWHVGLDVFPMFGAGSAFIMALHFVFGWASCRKNVKLYFNRPGQVCALLPKLHPVNTAACLPCTYSTTSRFELWLFCCFWVCDVHCPTILQIKREMGVKVPRNFQNIKIFYFESGNRFLIPVLTYTPSLAF